MKNYLLYFLFFLTFSFINIANSKTITTEPIDVRHNFSIYEKSSVIDASGNIHVAYGGDSVYYTLLSKGEVDWAITAIDSSPGLYIRGLDVDSSGLVHILATSTSERTWFYIYGNNEVGWNKEEIEELKGFYFDYNYITFKVNKSSGQAHIVYTHNQYELIHLTKGISNWEVENVEGSDFSDYVLSNDMVVDESGYVHIICESLDLVGDAKIHYLSNTSGAWVNETVSSISRQSFSGTFSLVLDSTSKAHIIFSDFDYYGTKIGTLYYATNTAESWVVEQIDTSDVFNSYSSLKSGRLFLDESGNVYAAYGYESQELRYAIRTETETGSSWTYETVSGDIEQLSKISGFGFIDSEAQIIFYDSTSEVMYRAYGSFGSWNIENVDNSQQVGYNSDMATDPSSGYLHVVYADETNDDLLYATNETSEWKVETIDSDGDFGWGAQIVVDDESRVHVCYFDLVNYDLKYAVRVDKVWSTETIDSTGNVGKYCSIAVDKDGIVHISYVDDTTTSTSSLEYAHGNKGSWVIETIIKGYSSTSINTDSSGKAHVVFLDYQGYNSTTKLYSYDVVHAVREDGVWVFETIDSFTVTNRGTGVSKFDIDSSDHIHVVYGFDLSTFSSDIFLKYATNKSGSWVTDEIDGGDDIYIIRLDFKVDDSGYGYILYKRDNSFYLAHGFSGAWAKESLGTTGTSHQTLSIGNDGTIHFAYKQAYYGLYHGTIVYCDGVVDEATECDDGNREDGDGCSALCEVETLYYSDEDGDGYGSETGEYFFTKPIEYAAVSGDCDDSNALVYPNASDDCDGISNDCDEEIDEDFVPTAPTTCGIGVCVAEGSTSCVDGNAIDSCTPALAGVEVCDNEKDDDCDGSTDEIEDCPVTGSSTSSDSTTGDPSTTGEGSGSGDLSSTGEGGTTSGEVTTTGEETTGGGSSSTGEEGSGEGATSTGEAGTTGSEPSTTGEGSSTGAETDAAGGATTSGEETTGGDSSSTGEGSGSTENGTTDGTTGGGESSTTGEEGSSSSSTSSDGSSESTGSDTSSSSDGSSTTSGGATDEGNPNPTPPPADGSAAEGSGGCSLII